MTEIDVIEALIVIGGAGLCYLIGYCAGYVSASSHFKPKDRG